MSLKTKQLIAIIALMFVFVVIALQSIIEKS